MEEEGSEENKYLEPGDLEFVRKFQNDMKVKFNNSVYSDVTIFIDHKVIRGHKIILMRNPLFSKMFASKPDLKEIYFSDQISDSVECDIKYLFCDDFDQAREEVLLFPSKACETFLRYLYGTEIRKEIIDLDLMLVAYKYSDEMLKDYCQNHLIKDVNVRNAVRTLLVSLETQAEKLKIEACKLIARNFNEMKFNQDLNPILENEDALSEILNVFDDCKIILLKSNEDENLENSLSQLRSSDLLITVGNYHFLAHKNILSQRNAVFEVIIGAVSSDGFPTSVNIPDVDVGSFTIFLNYVYTGEVVYCGYKVYKNLLKLAHTYTDDKLKDICEKEFLLKLDCNNVIELLLLSMKYECKHLQKCALNFIVVRYDKVLSQDDYQNLLQNPDAVNVLIRTLCERQKPGTEKNFFNGRFIVQLPTDSNIKIASENFELQNEKFLIAVKKSSEFGSCLLTIFLFVLQYSEPRPTLCSSLKLISAADKQHDIIASQNRFFNEGKYNDWGSMYLAWPRLVDPKYGYVKDGKITIEVDITAV